MTAKKTSHLIPTLLLVASSLTLAACSKSDTDTSAVQEETTSMIDNAISQTEQAAHDVTTLAEEATETVTDAATITANTIDEAASSATESTTSAIKEGAAAASTLAATTAKTVTETSAKVVESGSNAVKAATEKAAETKTAVTSKIAETTSSTTKAVTEKAAETKAAVTSKIAAAAPAASNNQVEMLELAKKSGCLSCHSIEKKIVGPAWRDVAAKYRGQSDAKSNIINSITNGSTGKWGTFAMPANSPRVSDEDIATLAGFVLSLQ